MTTTDMSKVLRSLEELEGVLADLYGWYAGLFEADEAAWEFFDQLSRDERNHQNMVQFQMRLVLRERKSFKDVDVDYNGILALTRRGRSLNGIDPTPSIEDAVLAALEIESNAAELYYKRIIVQSNPGVAGLIRTLSGENKRHFESVKDFAKKREYID